MLQLVAMHRPRYARVSQLHFICSPARQHAVSQSSTPTSLSSTLQSTGRYRTVVGARFFEVVPDVTRRQRVERNSAELYLAFPSFHELTG